MSKMRKNFLLTLAGLMLFTLSSYTVAGIDFGSSGEMSLQQVLNSITIVPGTGSSIDTTTDALLDMTDSYWSIMDPAGSTSTLIIEIAGFQNNNTFGIYDKTDPDSRVELFSGPDGSGDTVVVAIADNGSVQINAADTGIVFATKEFGYYLDSTHSTQGGLWHSDTILNSDGTDHMVAYQGTGADIVQIGNLAEALWTEDQYILAFEDLKTSFADNDYNDFVVMVESVTSGSVQTGPIPEPATIVLLGLGMLITRRTR